MKPTVEVLKMVSTPILAGSMGIYEEEVEEAYSRTVNIFLPFED